MMNAFLKKVVWFILPLCIIALLMESQLRSLDNVYKSKSLYLEKHAQELDILVLGSSHAFYNINPEYLQGQVYNAGAVSQSLDLDLEILKKYEEKLTNLNQLIIPVSYFSFYGKLKTSPEKWRIKDYVLYYDLDIANTVRDYFEVLSVKPKNNLKKLMKSMTITKVMKPCSNLGWGLNYVGQGPRDLKSTGIETAKRHSEKDVFSEESVEKYKAGIKDLEDILTWAKERGVKVLLVTPPSYSSYANNLNLDQLNLMVTYLNQVSDTYTNCTYINMLKDDNFIASDYYDADHLNHQGAKKLSLKLNTLLK